MNFLSDDNSGSNTSNEITTWGSSSTDDDGLNGNGVVLTASVGISFDTSDVAPDKAHASVKGNSGVNKNEAVYTASGGQANDQSMAKN